MMKCERAARVLIALVNSELADITCAILEMRSMYITIDASTPHVTVATKLLVLNMHQTIAGQRLIAALNAAGYRIFDITKAREFGRALGINQDYIVECLYHLRKTNIIFSLKKGLYAISVNRDDIHKYEIAMALGRSAALSHASALEFHGCNCHDEIVYITIPKGTMPRIGGSNCNISIINNVKYQFVQTVATEFFGVQQMWVGKSQIIVTNLERTLLDGLSKPKYCGGFAGLQAVFRDNLHRLDTDKLLRYSEKYDPAISKRLGLVLSRCGLGLDILRSLLERSINGYVKLDPTGPNIGVFNKRWMLRENDDSHLAVITM